AANNHSLVPLLALCWRSAALFRRFKIALLGWWQAIIPVCNGFLGGTKLYYVLITDPERQSHILPFKDCRSKNLQRYSGDAARFRLPVSWQPVMAYLATICSCQDALP